MTQPTEPRADFKRLKDQLAGRGLISEWNSLMWAMQPNQTEGGQDKPAEVIELTENSDGLLEAES